MMTSAYMLGRTVPAPPQEKAPFLLLVLQVVCSYPAVSRPCAARTLTLTSFLDHRRAINRPKKNYGDIIVTSLMCGIDGS